MRVGELKGRIKLAFPAGYPQVAMFAAMTGAITERGRERRGRRRKSPHPQTVSRAAAINPAAA